MASSMVQSVALSVLRRVLGEYVEELDRENLQLSLRRGDVRLEKLRLRRDALDALDLPIHVRRGTLRSVRVQIPWSALKSSSAQIEIDGLFLCAEPRPDEEYDAQRELSRAQTRKQQALALASLFQPRSKGKAEAEAESEDDSFTGRLFGRVLNNLQVSVRNIHVRYEDCLQRSERPFVAGLTLQSFSAVTVDGEWQPHYVVETGGLVHKLVSLQNFALYWESGGAPLPAADSEEQWLSHMERLIACGDGEAGAGETPPSLHYILQPISGELRLVLNNKRGTSADLSLPQRSLRFAFDAIHCSLAESQFRDFVGLSKSFRMATRRARFCDLKPSKPPLEAPREWWQYVGEAVLRDVRAERNRWSWDTMRLRKQNRLEYIQLYTNKALATVSSKEEASIARLQHLEEKLSYEDILMYRTLASKLIEQRREEEQDDEAPTVEDIDPMEHPESGAGGYLSWFWGAGAVEEDDYDDVSAASTGPRDVRVTQEVIRQLYDALESSSEDGDENAVADGDGEDERLASVSIPDSYVRTEMTFALRSGHLDLTRGAGDAAAKFTTVGFTDLNFSMQTRATHKTLTAALRDVVVHDLGTLSQSGVPIVARARSDEQHRGDSVFQLKVDIDPAHADFDYLVWLRLRPLNVMYSRPYIEDVAAFFASTSRHAWSDFNRLTGAADQLDALQKQASNQLRYVLDNRKAVSVDVEVAQPSVFVAEDVRLEECTMLVLACDSITVQSEVQERSALERLDLQRVQEYQHLFYDSFKLCLDSVELSLMAVRSDETDWSALSIAEDRVVLVQPLQIEFKVEHCLVDVAFLPELRLITSVPRARVFLSAKHFLKLIKCLRLVLDDGEEVEPFADPTTIVPFTEAEIVNLADPSVLEQQPIRSATHRQKQLVIFRVDNIAATVWHDKGDTAIAELQLQHFDLNVANLAQEMHVSISLSSLSIADLAEELDSPNRYLARTGRRGNNGKAEGHQGVRISLRHILSSAPEYVGIDYELDWDMQELRCICNRSTVVNIIDTANDIIDNIGDTAPPSVVAAAAAEAATNIDASERSVVLERGSRSSVAAVERAAGAKADVQTLFLNFRFRMQRLKIKFNKDEEQFAVATIRDWDQTLALRNNDTWKLSISVGATKLIDLRAHAKSARKVLTLDAQRALQFSFETYQEAQLRHTGDEEGTDIGYNTLLTLRICSMRYVYVQNFVTAWVGYFLEMDSMHDMLVASYARAQGLAVNVAVEEQLMKYDVFIENPIIEIPRSYVAPGRVYADLGKIHLFNGFRVMQSLEKADFRITSLSYNIVDMNLKLQLPGESDAKHIVRETTLRLRKHEPFDEEYDGPLFPQAKWWLDCSAINVILGEVQARHVFATVEENLCADAKDEEKRDAYQSYRATPLILGSVSSPRLRSPTPTQSRPRSAVALERQSASAVSHIATNSGSPADRTNGSRHKRRSLPSLDFAVPPTAAKPRVVQYSNFDSLTSSMDAQHMANGGDDDDDAAADGEKGKEEAGHTTANAKAGDSRTSLNSDANDNADGAQEVWVQGIYALHLARMSVDLYEGTGRDEEGTETKVTSFQIDRLDVNMTSDNTGYTLADFDLERVVLRDERYDFENEFVDVLSSKHAGDQVLRLTYVSYANEDTEFSLIMEHPRIVLTPWAYERLWDFIWPLFRGALDSWDLWSNDGVVAEVQSEEAHDWLFKVTISNPEIVIVEDAEDEDCSALILRGVVLFKQHEPPEGGMLRTVHARQLEAFRCELSDEENTTLNLLNPTDITLYQEWNPVLRREDWRIACEPMDVNISYEDFLLLTRLYRYWWPLDDAEKAQSNAVAVGTAPNEEAAEGGELVPVSEVLTYVAEDQQELSEDETSILGDSAPSLPTLFDTSSHDDSSPLLNDLNDDDNNNNNNNNSVGETLPRSSGSGLTPRSDGSSGLLPRGSLRLSARASGVSPSSASTSFSEDMLFPTTNSPSLISDAQHDARKSVAEEEEDDDDATEEQDDEVLQTVYRIRTAGIFVRFLNDFYQQHVPVALINISSCLARISSAADHFKTFAQVTTAMDVYNAALQVWEPLLEPWAVQFNYTSASIADDAVHTSVVAEDVLNLNLTQESIATLVTTWSDLTADFYKKAEPRTERLSRINVSPYLLQNMTGTELWVWRSDAESDVVEVPVNGRCVPLPRGEQRATLHARYRNPARPKAPIISVKVAGDFLVARNFRLEEVGIHALRVDPNNRYNLVLRVLNQRGSKVVQIRSNVLLRNKLCTTIEVQGFAHSVGHVKLRQIAPNQVYALPIAFLQGRLRFRPVTVTVGKRQTMPLAGSLGWKWSGQGLVVDTLSKGQRDAPIVMTSVAKGATAKMVGSSWLSMCVVDAALTPEDDEVEELISEDCHLLTLAAAYKLENLLALTCFYRVIDADTQQVLQQGKLKKGKSCDVVVDVRRHLQLSLRLTDFRWSTPKSITGPRTSRKLELVDATQMVLGINMNYVRFQSGVTKISLFSKYWLVNRTGTPLLYSQQVLNKRVVAAGQLSNLQAIKEEERPTRAPAGAALSINSVQSSISLQPLGDDPLEVERRRFLPLMFSSERVGKRIAVRAALTEWSSPVNIRSTGQPVVVELPQLSRHQHVAGMYSLAIAVDRAPGRFWRTQRVTVFPRIILINNMNRNLLYTQRGCNKEFKLRPDQQSPFHWIDCTLEKLLCVCAEEGSWNWSAGFPIADEERKLTIKIRNLKGDTLLLNVRTMMQEASIVMAFSEENLEFPTYRILNSSAETLRIHQYLTRPSGETVKPGEALSYAWDEPSLRPLLLQVECESGEQILVNLNRLGIFNTNDPRVPLRLDPETGVGDFYGVVSVDGPTKVVTLKYRSATHPFVGIRALRKSRRLIAHLSLLGGVGISVINKEPRELMYITLQEIVMDYEDSTRQQRVDFSIGSFQIDNCSVLTSFPVMLFARKVTGVPFFRLKMSRAAEYSSVHYMKELAMEMQNFDLNLDDEVFLQAWDFVSALSSSSSSSSSSTTTADASHVDASRRERERELVEGEPHYEVPVTDLKGRQIFLKRLYVSGAQILVSFLNTESQAQKSGETEVSRIIRTVGALANIERAPIQLPAMRLADAFLSRGELVDYTWAHYSRALRREVGKVVASADFLGAPMALVGNLGEGWRDFVDLPKAGAQRDGARGALMGVGAGTRNLLKSGVYGTFNSLSKISGTIGDGMSSLALDEDYEKSRQQLARTRPQHAAQGLAFGARDFGLGLFRGITGIFTEPVKGAKQEGVPGFFKGISRGITGLYVKPVVGTVDLLTRASEGIRNTATYWEEGEKKRRRTPRYFGPEGVLEPYSALKAEGQFILYHTAHARFYEQREYYRFHVAFNESVLVVTDVSLMSLKESSLALEWIVAIADIERVECFEDGVAIYMKPRGKKRSAKHRFINCIIDERSRSQQLYGMLMKALGGKLERDAKLALRHSPG